MLRSGPISRVLSWATISLGRRLPAASSSRPESGNGPNRPACSLARTLLSAWPCSPWGLPCHSGHPERGALLPHLFTLTDLPKPTGGIFSVALSRSLRTVGVTHHGVLWSPDFPPRTCARGGHPAHSEATPSYQVRRSNDSHLVRGMVHGHSRFSGHHG